MTYQILSDSGSRVVNEDSVSAVECNGNYCFVIADGLGGHRKGDIASKTVVDVFRQEFEKPCDDTELFLRRSFAVAQGALLAEHKTRRDAQGIKTTVAALIILNGKARWGFIGDSRLYWFRGGKLKKRTFDHSVPQMLVMTKEIKEKELCQHPDRNKLLRVMGANDGECDYELSEEYSIYGKDAFLLCTDGFWEYIDDKAIRKALKRSYDAARWLDEMVQIVTKAGKDKDMDNYSAIAVKYG